MGMRLDKADGMDVLARVVEAGSFSAAARTLGTTPSAVSKRVAQLEDRLGVRLLNRTTRRLSLTDVGRGYYQRAQRILADIEEAEQFVMQQSAVPRGTVRLTASVAFGHRQIVPLLPELLLRHPELRVELSLTDRLVDVVGEGFDVAIRFGPLEDSTLIGRRLAADRRIVAAAPAYLARQGTPRHPRDLAQHNCLGFAARGQLNEWAFRTPEGPLTVKIAGSLSADSAEALRAAAVAGLGIVRLATFAIGRDVAKGRLQALLRDFEAGGDRAIHAVYPESRHLSPKVRALVDFLAEKLADAPWERD